MFSNISKRLFHFQIKPIKHQIRVAQVIQSSPNIFSKNTSDSLNEQKLFEEKISQFFPETRTKIISTLSKVGNAYQNSNESSLNESFSDLSNLDLETLASVCRENDLEWLIEQKEASGFESVLVKSIIPRNDVSPSFKLKLAEKFPSAFDRLDFEELIQNILSSSQVLESAQEDEDLSESQQNDSKSTLGKARATLMLAAYRSIFGLPSEGQDLTNRFKQVIQENCIKFDLSQPDPVYDPKSYTGERFVPTGVTLTNLVLGLKKYYPLEALTIFHTHFYNVPNYEKKVQGCLLLDNIMQLNRKLWGDSRPNKKLFMRYMDEKNKNTDRYIPPTDTTVRMVGSSLEELASVVFYWKYEHALNTQSVIDFLSIKRKKLGHENKLEAVWQLVQEPFSISKAHKLTLQWEEDKVNDLKKRQEKNKIEKESRKSAPKDAESEESA